jgi:hypothetical protein
MNSLRLTQAWLWLSAWASFAGWFLSWIGHLDIVGYSLLFAATVLGLVFFRKFWRVSNRSWNLRKLRWRFRHPAFLSFAVLALLVFLGGVLYPPSNYTALTYRLPRVLHWLSHSQWYWIHSSNFRMNDRACGIEWLSAPILLFTRSDRLLFLLNFIPFLLLPGLLFHLLNGLGIKRRVAWQWMWFLPTGFNFLLQGASTANDTFPTIYALAMIVFGLRAWKTGRTSDLWFSLLAAALMTGAKASNLPLLLPCAVVIAPRARLLLRRPFASAVVLALAVIVSFLPTAALNLYYCHDWTGARIENAGLVMKHPFVGVWGNALLIALDNFAPPIFPVAGWWNQNALTVAPQFIAGPMSANFEPGFQMLGELPTEDFAGLGFGISILLAISFVAAIYNRRKSSIDVFIPVWLRRALVIAPWISLLVYAMKSGMVTPARLIAPYYPLLLPLLLVLPGHAAVVRRRWWNLLVWGNFLLALLVLVLTPGRPLWPAETILSRAAIQHPSQRLLARAAKVYAVYATRADPLADVRKFLPPDANVVGFIGTEDDTSISVWRPYGSRRVEEFLVDDSAEEIRRQNIQYVVLGGYNLAYHNTTLAAWLEKSRAEMAGVTSATIKVSEGPQPWYVVRLKETPATP